MQMNKMSELEKLTGLETLPLNQHPLSASFIKTCNKIGWLTIEDIFNAGLEKVAEHPKINDEWFDELLAYLRELGMLYRMNP
uniref:RNA polymerase alpha subunit C-terminal domain-containing protein n=3 Tax=Sphingobacteriaceae TaxID=84566 RepID=F4C126_SPHS2